LYVARGQQVALEGGLQTRQWDDADGKRHSKTEVVAGSLRPPANACRARARTLLAAGVLGSSFRFSVPLGGDSWERMAQRSAHNPEGLQERTTREARVFEFGPVVFPAYVGATSGISTGGHPPRSQRMSDADWDRFLGRVARPRSQSRALGRRGPAWRVRRLPTSGGLSILTAGDLGIGWRR
jgi:single-stranded DNA-binding protein